MVERVLLVDDDEDLRTIGELTLREVGGWDVRCASDGAEALTLAAAWRPDVVLLDVMMPGLDGPQTIRRLQANGAGEPIPVIFMTARVQKHERESYLALGAAGVIAKPFDPMHLPDQIRQIVEASKR